MLSPVGRAVLREVVRQNLAAREAASLARLRAQWAEDAETIADLPDEIAPSLLDSGFYDDPSEGAR